METNFVNQVAVVTGAGSGIGRATAQTLAELGATVVNVDRNAERLDELVARLPSPHGQRHHGVDADLRSVDASRSIGRRAAELAGQVDILVNSAGVCHFNRMGEISQEEWDEVFEVDLRSLHYLSVGAGEVMSADRGGRIINLSSSAGRKGRSLSAHYSAAKAGVINLTEALALTYAPKRITVNAVCPGPTNTDLWKLGFSELERITGKTGEQIQQGWIDSTPLKRMGRVDDVVNLIVFLASDRASFITGQSINVCGGFTLTN